jgi:hypothetical protein
VTVHRLVVKLPHISGLAKDTIVNTFHFDGLTDAQANGDAVNALVDFYNVDPGGVSVPLARYLSTDVDRGASLCEIDVYTLPAVRGDIGSPISRNHFTLGVAHGGDTPYPGEVACVLTLAASMAGISEHGPADAAIPTDEAAIDEGAPATHPGSDRLKSRRRGRIYLGPLGSSSGGSTADGVRPTDDFRTHIIAAAFRLQQAVPTGTGGALAVFSHRDWVARQAQTGTVDNAFDTQRRRGVVSTSRMGSPSNLLAG